MIIENPENFLRMEHPDSTFKKSDQEILEDFISKLKIIFST